MEAKIRMLVAMCVLAALCFGGAAGATDQTTATTMKLAGKMSAKNSWCLNHPGDRCPLPCKNCVGTCEGAYCISK